MDIPFFLPVVLARIRIPIPAEWVGPILLVSLVVAFIASLFLLRQDSKRWGWPALGALVVADLVFMVARLVVGSGGYSLPIGFIVSPIVSHALLVWSALVVWAFRQRLDAAGVVLAAVVFALCCTPVTTLLGGFQVAPFHLGSMVLRALGALCFLGALALIGSWLRPAWAGVFAGVLAGSLLQALVTSLASPVLFPNRVGALPVLSQLLRAEAWAFAHGLVAGVLFAIAVWLLKPEQESGRRTIGPLQ